MSCYLYRFCFFTSFSDSDTLRVQTKNGVVRGIIQSHPVPGIHGNASVRAFLGIPFAKPPLGPLRFKPPQPAEKWTKDLEAFSYSNSCFHGSEMWNPNTPLSEDCLYLNVWTPRVKTSQPQTPAPVMVWIYGGGFTTGTSSLPLYSGLFLSSFENVVVVSMNYRLGALGFFTLPNHRQMTGNLGLLDQQLALRWVSENIAAFGGDPSQVTIFGESAGSGSVGYQLLSPGSKHLFQRAVMQSGSPNAHWGSVSLETAWKRTPPTSLRHPYSCTSIFHTCIKACYKTIHYNFTNLKYTPIAQNVPKKDLLIGLNQNEGSFFLPYGAPGFSLNGQSLISRAQFLEGIPIVLPQAGTAVREAAIFQYTDWTDENNMTKNRDHMSSLVADYMFVCPVLEFIQKWWMGVMHGYEIEFIFGMPLNASLGYTKNEVNMTMKFMKHWANFARTGNPSIDGAAWPSYSANKMEYATLNYHHPETRSYLKAHECRLWSAVIPEIQKLSGR
uniref:Carboxylic ester hydrolase n=1 Tax=Periophthalmus magnuspinnatus TaxID=409849 RepID=A0A3B4A6S9_9GOBI